MPSERDPLFRVPAPEGQAEAFAYRDNTTLFQHLGHAALDHIFVAINENTGVYVWSDNEHYETALAQVAAANCMMILNIPEPSETDVKAYIRHHTEDVDELPDWLPEV